MAGSHTSCGSAQARRLSTSARTPSLNRIHNIVDSLAGEETLAFFGVIAVTPFILLDELQSAARSQLLKQSRKSQLRNLGAGLVCRRATPA